MGDGIKTFEDLLCWQKATELRRAISKLIKSFPKEEKFLLVDQLKRASRSVTNNIAEGYGRFHFLDNAKFCRNSRGSLYEILDHLIISLDEEYLDSQQYEELRSLTLNSIQILNGFINYLIKQNEEK